jgi:hypothetical protein
LELTSRRRKQIRCLWDRCVKRDIELRDRIIRRSLEISFHADDEMFPLEIKTKLAAYYPGALRM